MIPDDFKVIDYVAVQIIDRFDPGLLFIKKDCPAAKKRFEIYIVFRDKGTEPFNDLSF